ncbi:MAG: NAD(P)H-binding protein, partial [Actinomycetota bacterium]|nr:NAD(P)H-binding protein [Actinomycetota bacterium]
GADDPASASEEMRPYQQAKHDADEALMRSSLDWTILRPGRLTNAPAAGRVALATRLGRSGEVTREDVALVLLAMLDAENTVRGTSEVLEGDTPVAEAVAALR